MDRTYGAVVDSDFIGIPVCGGKAQSDNNGHFESTCYHLLLFNGEDDCLPAMLQPGSLHSAEGQEELLLPEI
jgi:hypothetical protein